MWEGCILPRHKQKMAKQIYRTLIEPSFNTVALLGDASECIGQTFILLSEVLLAAAY